MAMLENVSITPMAIDVGRTSKGIFWVPVRDLKATPKVPHIFFNDGEPWLAANTYALNKLESVAGNNIKTVLSNMSHLKAYACWLEDNNIDWRHFPQKKKDRCLFQYRGFLIRQREAGLVSPSTASTRMSAIIHFYRWAQLYGWIDREPMWIDRAKAVRFFNTVGFSRTMSVVSSELAVPNRKRVGGGLEDGLMPLTDENRATLLSFLFEQGKVELYLMTIIGFFTGARSETIRTLRLSNLHNAQSDATIPSMKRIAVGPGTAVKTKYDVSGTLPFPSALIDQLEHYAYSVRRLNRQARASNKDKTLLFLSERGNGYSETSFTKLISYLREKLAKEGLDQFREFKFHQTRATYGTQLMRLAMNILPSQVDAIVFVRDAMLHKDEATTWKYVRFIEKEPVKEALSDEFFNLYVGKSNEFEQLIDKVTYNDRA
ncbi:MAG: tyrosine-type recombinase/integrase [Pseudomonas sp.]|nr:tyrosine-type recombinase/integrase [Pseudomonas sp.]